MFQLQGVAVNYHESTEIRYSVKVKIDLAYFRLRLHMALAAQKPAESDRIMHGIKRSRLEFGACRHRVNP
jgi:hypothetical protein